MLFNCKKIMLNEMGMMASCKIERFVIKVVARPYKNKEVGYLKSVYVATLS